MYSPGWSQTCIYIAKNNLEYLILLLPPKYWDYRYTLLGLAKEKIVCFCL